MQQTSVCNYINKTKTIIFCFNKSNVNLVSVRHAMFVKQTVLPKRLPTKLDIVSLPDLGEVTNKSVVAQTSIMIS